MKEKLIKIEEQIREAQSKVNDSKKVKLYSDMTREELEEQLQEAKMEIFKLWYLQHTGNKYEL